MVEAENNKLEGTPSQTVVKGDQIRVQNRSSLA